MKIRIPGLGFHDRDGASSSTRPVFVYLAASVLAITTTPYRHSLLTSSVSWVLVWLYCVSRCGIKRRGLKEGKRKAARIAGLLFGISTVCERVTGDRTAVSTLRSFLPLLTLTLSYLVSDAFSRSSLPSTSTNVEVPKQWLPYNSRYLVALSTTAIATFMGGTYMSPQATIISLAAAVTQACGLLMLETINGGSMHDKWTKDSESGTSMYAEIPVHENDATAQESLEVTKLMALRAVISCAAGSAYIESVPNLNDLVLLTSNDGTISYVMSYGPLVGSISAPFTTALSIICFVRTVLEFGALRSAVSSLWTVIGASFCFQPSVLAGWLWSLYSLSSVLYWTTIHVACGSSGTASPRTAQSSLLSYAVTLVVFVSFFISALPSLQSYHLIDSSKWHSVPAASYEALEAGQPMILADRTQHPIKLLGLAAQARFNRTLSSQSQTLSDAVVEYRRRYGVHPPPNFDKWFEFAKKKGTVLIDEFDSMYHNLLPFWAFSPQTLRERVNQAFGYDVNGLMTLMIRDGQITLMDGSREWLRDSLREMTAGFIDQVPDMDIAFNIHDEPRVTVPHSELAQMVHQAKSVALPAVLANDAPRNAFSPKPDDMTNGKQYDDTTITRFNKFSHQPTWSHARLSCPPDSPARDFLEQAPDNLTSYAFDDLGFIYNTTAFSDICNSPSLRDTYGFFERPNVFIPTQDLVPVFSQSKLSSFQDIILPSPWYWADKVQYDDKEDMPWDQKDSKLYWRGTTTGGYSRYGGWRRHHRQRCVQKINSPNDAQVLQNRNNDGDGPSNWRTEKVSRADFTESIDVHFSDVGQCDSGDCHAQKEFFHIAKMDDQKAAWGYKFLLDMDGNAFSGRFLAFLKSNSIVYKMALFREWHADWVQPWLHYVPLSLKGDEWLEAVRYFAGEEEGKQMAQTMATESQDWANKALRKEDMEVWLFRLLLEYGRLLDDDRQIIGYAGP